MNKQELIESIAHLPSDCSGPRPMIDKITVLELIKLLDEPQKVAVPQFVANWYEENKDDFEGNLFRCINTISSMYEDEELNDFENWVIEAHTEPFQTLVNMHQFGYTIEKKWYLVKMKGLSEYTSYLNYDSIDDKWHFADDENGPVVGTHHTREQLEKAGFGWVFDCPGVEVREVENE